ncbi:MAG: hypothetical protein ACI9DJ_002332 [Algoriphagus sp.]|jgi:hypothetical protein
MTYIYIFLAGAKQQVEKLRWCELTQVHDSALDFQISYSEIDSQKMIASINCYASQCSPAELNY